MTLMAVSIVLPQPIVKQMSSAHSATKTIICKMVSVLSTAMMENMKTLHPDNVNHVTLLVLPATDQKVINVLIALPHLTSMTILVFQIVHLDSIKIPPITFAIFAT
jgi:hypothetical protein